MMALLVALPCGRRPFEYLKSTGSKLVFLANTIVDLLDGAT
jgi:hypothetical protein